MSQCQNAPKIPLLTISVSIVLRGGFANIPRAQVRSRYVRLCALSKIVGAFIPRAHSRSRYDRFCPLRVLDREDVISGLFSSIQSALCVEIVGDLGFG